MLERRVLMHQSIEKLACGSHLAMDYSSKPEKAVRQVEAEPSDDISRRTRRELTPSLLPLDLVKLDQAVVGTKLTACQELGPADQVFGADRLWFVR